MSVNLIKPSKVFWAVGAFLLLWGILGVSMYILEMTMSEAAYLETYGQSASDIRHSVPTWSVAGYAVGVWTGLLAAILLLMRRAWAVPAYLVSLLGAAVGWSWYIFDPRAKAVMGEQGGWIMMVAVFSLCAFSLWWAKRQKAHGILR